MTAKKRKDFGHVSSCSCDDCTDDTLVDQTVDLLKLLMKRSPKMVKHLSQGKRGGSSPLGPMAMDWGFDLARPYPDFKGICRGILSYDDPNFQDDDTDLNIFQCHFTLP